MHGAGCPGGECVHPGCLELAPCDRVNFRLADHHQRRRNHDADVDIIQRNELHRDRRWA
jgi:hypothetical protein